MMTSASVGGDESDAETAIYTKCTNLHLEVHRIFSYKLSFIIQISLRHLYEN